MPGEYGFIINAGGNVIGQMALYEESVAKFGATTKIQTKEVQQSFNLMGEGMASTFKNLKSLLLTGLGITALFEGWEFIENSKVKFEALEKQIVKVDTVLKSTGFKAGFSTEDIQDQSKALSKTIVNQRDEILQAQAVLLSYSNIRGQIFKKATSAVADYATFFGQDMSSGARILGRALQDPLQGMNQLRRAGIVLSAQQKEQIKNYEQQGQLVKAQGVLLDELSKKFGGQAAAYALTDAGKIQVASKAFTELQYRIGEVISRVEVSLIPSFIHITEVLKNVFNSSTIQFFIAHLKDLVSIVLKLIPIWVAYKTVMIASSLVTSGMAIAQKILAVSLGQTAVAVDGTIVSLEGFKAALVSTGIGALIVGIGLLVEKFIDMNSEIDQTTNKLSNIAEITYQFNSSQESAAKANIAFSNLKNLSAAQKSSLAGTIATQIKDIKDKLAESVIPQLPKTRQSLHEESDIAKKIPFSIFNSITWAEKYGFNKQAENLGKDLKNTNKIIGDYNKTLAHLLTMQATLQKQGIKPLNYQAPGAGLQDNAYATSSLAGAKGGLGEAKIINIHIGTLQKNEGVHESASQSQAAVELLIRTLNNIAYSSSGTF